MQILLDILMEKGQVEVEMLTNTRVVDLEVVMPAGEVRVCQEYSHHMPTTRSLSRQIWAVVEEILQMEMEAEEEVMFF
jgi:hypothetical protein